ncbi:MAG: hydrolase 1, exosortase A system-associated [Pelomonas sp.]|nr:hydrolase 1, exosortase A system-associated [Roseateles sp.]
MSWQERALHFDCEGEALIGVLGEPPFGVAPHPVGVLIVVGGPQYRVGSHRQFVLLARALAAAGHRVLRFDYRGMGDSAGAPRDFRGATPDIAAALDAFAQACPGLERVALWGLCDAASAALLYCDERGADARVAGLCLLNPWVRSEAGLARAQVRHYYLQRLREPAFWRKLLAGKVARTAATELVAKLRLARAAGKADKRPSPADAPFQARMARAWRERPALPRLLILSGRDLTAREFVDHAANAPDWRGLLEQPAVRRVDLAAADHTFSTAAWRGEVERLCVDWLAALA